MSDSVRQRVVAIMNALMPAGDFVPARSLSFGKYAVTKWQARP